MTRVHNNEHRIEDICYRGPWFISCICGFSREWNLDEVKAMEFGGVYEEIEVAWLLHRREHGMTKR